MYTDVCLQVWSFLGQAAGNAAANAVTANVTNAAPAEGGFSWMGVLRYILMVIYLLVCVGLVVIILNKNTKSDGLVGLTGAGSANQNSYHGKKSYEENMSMAANYLAVSFIVLSMVISLVMR